MANFNYRDFASGYDTPELMGATHRTSKLDGWTQQGKDRKKRLKEEKIVLGYAKEAKNLGNDIAKQGGNYEAVAGGVNRLLELKKAVQGKNRVDVSVHDIGVRVLRTAFSKAAGVWSKYISNIINTYRPVLKSSDANQLMAALSDFENFRSATMNNTPVEVKDTNMGNSGRMRMLSFLRDLKTAYAKAQVIAAKNIEITAFAKGQTQAMIEVEKDEGVPLNNLAMPLMIGGGALALVLALKG